MSTCRWCKGTGLYYPLTGIPEPCHECQNEVNAMTGPTLMVGEPSALRSQNLTANPISPGSSLTSRRDTDGESDFARLIADIKKRYGY